MYRAVKECNDVQNVENDEARCVIPCDALTEIVRVRESLASMSTLPDAPHYASAL
jgi:hypothetical protein